MRQKITMNSQKKASVEERFQQFLSNCAARGLSEKTIRGYKNHLHCLSKYLDIAIPLPALTKSEVEMAVAHMRKEELSPNSICSYIRTFKVFLSWCKEEGYADITIPAYKPRETIKETYSDEELKKLLEKPATNCSFCEYRSWIVIQFLLNSGCRASTIRNIQNRDVDLESRQVLFRHTKTRKVQVIPLCSTLVAHLKDYMRIRKGEPEDYLFCNEHGEMLTENALRLAIVRYNQQRGVKRTSIHMFRHTFARKYLLDCGGNAFTLQKLLGHSTLEMTKRYCAIFNADIANGFDNLSPLEQLSAHNARLTMPKKRK